MADKTDSQTFFRWLLRIYVWLLEQAYGLNYSKLVEVKIKMKYNVKDDNPSVGFEVDVTDVKDAEGNVISDPQLTIDVTSSDESVVAVSNTNGKGSVSFGNPGTASVQVEVKDQNGNLLASGGDTFTVTTGDPASIGSVSTKFDGLTPAEEAAPAAPATTTESSAPEAPAQ